MWVRLSILCHCYYSHAVNVTCTKGFAGPVLITLPSDGFGKVTYFAHRLRVSDLVKKSLPTPSPLRSTGSFSLRNCDRLTPQTQVTMELGNIIIRDVILVDILCVPT